MPAHRLCFDRTPVPDVGRLVAAFEAMAFASPMRSTVPLVALLRDAPARLDEILTGCGLAAGGAALHVEYRVHPGVEGSRPSQTDLMALTDTGAAAIEAKWTEPRYPTVAEWLASDEGDGTRRRKVLQGWLDLLRPHAARTPAPDECGGAVYQMLHRAASACATGRAPRLVYLHFTPSPAEGAATAAQYRDDLTHLHRLLGSPAAFPFYLVEVALTREPGFEGIAHLPRGQPATDELVRSALLLERLFEFDGISILAVGGRASGTT